MGLKNKFSIGDTVYFLSKNKVKTGIVFEIKIIALETNLQTIRIWYGVGKPSGFRKKLYEEELYASKEELLKHIEQQLYETKVIYHLDNNRRLVATERLRIIFGRVVFRWWRRY